MNRSTINRRRHLGRLPCLLYVAVILACQAVSAQCWSPSFSPGPVFKTTGDFRLDQKFNMEGNLIYRVFGVNPNMFLFDDGANPNAYATPVTTLSGYLGTVYFGVGLMRNQLWSMDKGEAAVAGIMAHEFSHILQAKMGSRLSGKYRELHADFMAGYYLLQKSYVTRADIRPFAQSLFEIGDYDFWSPAHHGTPEERVAAMVAGYNTGGSLNEAFRSGERYVLGGQQASANDSDDAPALRQQRSVPADVRDDSDEGFCSDLKTYTRAALRNFSSLRGSPDPMGEGEAFAARAGIQGFNDCTIWIYRDRSMEPSANCDYEGDDSLESLRGSLSKCLGSGWSSRESTVSGRTEYVFEGPNGITVRTNENSHGKIELWVDAPSRD